jgi:DNA-directed RNA polymerase subunit omega
MIYPSIDKLLNIINSKYILVHITAIRANQMIIEPGHVQLNEYRAEKPIGRALEEISEGLIHIK